jgi:flagellar hook assembly protein FlgD
LPARAGGPEAAEVRVSIYNVRGQPVRKLVNGFLPAGFFAVRWDGRDDGGGAVSSGVYFILLRVGNQQLTREVTLQK